MVFSRSLIYGACAVSLFATACGKKEEPASVTKVPSTAEVICSYAPSQSNLVAGLATTAGGSAAAAATVAQAAGLTAVLHSSGAYIFTGAGGYVAGTIGGAVALPAIVTVGAVVGGSVLTLELVCAAKNHPALASQVEAAASEFMKRSKNAAASASQHAVATTGPMIVDAKSVVARVAADAFEYANRASIQLSEAIQSKKN